MVQIFEVSTFMFSLLVLLLTEAGFAGEHPSLAREWEDLLHIRDGHSSVTTDGFYLSTEKTSLSEYEAIKTAITENATEIICTFPLRATYVQIAENLPTIDFSSCVELVEFQKSFQNKHVSIGVASETFGSAASAFGHVMLVLHDSASPELDSDVIHYAALPNPGDGPIQYIARGLAGGYRGRFLRNRLFEKLHEYTVLEQRFVFIHPVRISEQQIKRLVWHLFELRSAGFQYYFLMENCGYQIDALLAVALSQNFNQKGFYRLPFDVAKKYTANTSPTAKFQPTSTLAKNAYESLSSVEKASFDEVRRGSGPLPTDATDSLKQSLFYFYHYDFRSNGVIRENHFPVTRAGFSGVIPTDATNSPIENNYPSRIALGLSLERGETYLGFRPTVKDLLDNHLYSSSESELVLLEPKISFSKNVFRLDSATFFRVTSLPPISALTTPMSWTFKFELSRNYIGRPLAPSFEYGMGHSARFKHRLSLGYLVGPGLEIYSGVAPRGHVAGHAIWYPLEKTKLFQQVSYSRYPKLDGWLLKSSIIQEFKGLQLLLSYERNTLIEFSNTVATLAYRF